MLLGNAGKHNLAALLVLACSHSVLSATWLSCAVKILDMRCRLVEACCVSVQQLQQFLCKAKCSWQCVTTDQLVCKQATTIAHNSSRQTSDQRVAFATPATTYECECDRTTEKSSVGLVRTASILESKLPICESKQETTVP